MLLLKIVINYSMKMRRKMRKKMIKRILRVTKAISLMRTSAMMRWKESLGVSLRTRKLQVKNKRWLNKLNKLNLLKMNKI